MILAQFAAGQDSSFTLVRTFKGDISDAAMDPIGNLYILSSNGGIRKYAANGDSVGVYNAVRNFGKLTSIDVSNPLRILLFYKDFSTVVILDRFLANVATINLKTINILQPTAIGLAYDNAIWIFDEYDNKLKKIDQQSTLLFETPDIRTALNQSLAPERIINDNGLVYLADTISGIFVFDNYGAFKRRIPVTNWQSIAINQNHIVSMHREIITIFDTSTQIESRRKNPMFQPYLHAFFTTDRFITFSSQQLQIYQFKL